MNKNLPYNLIEVVRCRQSVDGTFGRLFVNGEFYCYTLEPPMPKVMVKPYPIPCGTYDLTLSVQSPKYRYRWPYNCYKGCVPRLLNVPGFDGILIHIGNFAKDTLGCILVGEKASLRRLYYSTNAYIKLYNKLKSFKYPIKIKISCV